ncbi:DcaP family trimeric outer membrane transporter [Catenovulum sediminis]|uniref:DcaP family trimeric outer membrane transporter n=1 Tax=Catenovulum sediminis TaxID=1740262 RepID=A0ABV1RI81_9ALTE
MKNIVSFVILAGLSLTTAQVQSKNTDKQALSVISTEFSFGGMIKFDAIHDLGVKTGDRIHYTAIPLNGDAADGHTRFHAKQSKFNAKATTSTNKGKITSFVEVDFFGDGTNSAAGSEVISNSVKLRLRHAHISWNGWLFGQAWSNFTDYKSYPETLDFANDTGQSLIRQAQIRYTTKADNFVYAIALENPESDFVDGDNAVRKNSYDRSPDVTFSAKYLDKFGHLSFQSVVRDIGMHDGQMSDNSFALGVSTSGKVKVSALDMVKFNVGYGEGIGRYLQEGANSAAFISNQKVNLQTSYGGYFSYQRRFSDNWRSNISFGYLKIDWDKQLLTASNESLKKVFTSMHTNLIYQPVSQLKLGIEYSRASRKVVNDERGDVERLQFSAAFTF